MVDDKHFKGHIWILNHQRLVEYNDVNKACTLILESLKKMQFKTKESGTMTKK